MPGAKAQGQKIPKTRGSQHRNGGKRCSKGDRRALRSQPWDKHCTRSGKAKLSGCSQKGEPKGHDSIGNSSQLAARETAPSKSRLRPVCQTLSTLSHGQATKLVQRPHMGSYTGPRLLLGQRRKSLSVAVGMCLGPSERQGLQRI